MSTYDQIIEGLTIFKKYKDNNAGSFAAEHDEIFAGPSPEDVSEADKKKLEELGWHESDYECFSKFV
jgi:hypothetical protein